jgi:GTP cyclohydrolase FolE2
MCIMRSFVILLGLMLACCAGDNKREQQTADAAYAQCARAAARTLALSSTEAADLVAEAAARSCPGQLKMIENSRVLPLGSAYAAASFAEDVVRDMAKTVEADVVQARQTR